MLCCFRVAEPDFGVEDDVLSGRLRGSMVSIPDQWHTASSLHVDLSVTAVRQQPAAQWLC